MILEMYRQYKVRRMFETFIKWEIYKDLNFTLDKLGFKVEDDNSVLAEGSCLIRDLNKELGFDLPISGPKTLNGLIIEYIQEIPDSGTTLKIENYLIEILKKEEMAVKLARIKSINVI